MKMSKIMVFTLGVLFYSFGLFILANMISSYFNTTFNLNGIIIAIYLVFQLMFLLVSYLIELKDKVTLKNEYISSIIYVLLNTFVLIYLENNYSNIQISNNILGIVYGGGSIILGNIIIFKIKNCYTPLEIFMQHLKLYININFNILKIMLEFIFAVVIEIILINKVDIKVLILILVITIINVLINMQFRSNDELIARKMSKLSDIKKF